MAASDSTVQRRPSRLGKQACNHCRAWKARCDDHQPCGPCVRRHVECVREDKRRLPPKRPRGPTLEQRLAQIESALDISGPAGKEKSTSQPVDSVNVPAALARAVPPSGNVLGNGSTASAQKIRDTFDIPAFQINKDAVDYLQSTIRNGSCHGPFIRMPYKVQLVPLVERFLEGTNAMVPIFSRRQQLLQLCEGELPKTPRDCSAARWACLNAIIGTVLQQKTVNSEFVSLGLISWSYFKNAFSVHQALAKTCTVLSTQAMLCLVVFLRGSTDTQTTGRVLSAARAMVRQLTGQLARGDTTEAEADIKRLHWVVRFLESTSPPPHAPLSSPCAEIPEHRLAQDYSSPSGRDLVFRMRLELAIFESQARRCGHRLQNGGSPADIVPELRALQARLETWKQNMPPVTLEAADNEMGIFMLNCAFHQTTDVVRRAFPVDLPLRPCGFPGAAPPSDMAEPILSSLLRLSTPMSLSFPDLWQLMPYMLSAAISLLAHILQYRDDKMAVLDSFVLFVQQQQEGGCDLGRLLRFARALTRTASVALGGPRTADSQPLPEYLQMPMCSASASDLVTHEILSRLSKALAKSDPMRLAYGLLGNTPTLQAEATGVFSITLGSEFRDADGMVSVAPAALQPATFGFLHETIRDELATLK